MRAILSDVNIQGHVNRLYSAFIGSELNEIWETLHLPHITFADLGLDQRTSDADVWQLCQREQYILITANRNNNGPDSLEATIRTYNTPNSLPVFTLANSRRVLRSHDYAEKVAERLLELLLDMENLRGSGRLFLP